MNIRDYIKANQATTKTTTVTVGEAKVTIRQMSVSENGVYMQKSSKSPEEATLYLIKTCVVDDGGKPVFTDKDNEFLLKTADQSMLPLFKEIWDFNFPKNKSDEEGKD